MIVPVILRLLIAWMTGIFCADALTALRLHGALPPALGDGPICAVAFTVILYLAMIACHAVARRRAMSPRFVTRYRSVRWRGAALLLAVLSLAFLKAYMEMPVGAEGTEVPFTSPPTDRTGSTLLPDGVIAGFRTWCMDCIDCHRPDPSVRGLVRGCLLGDRSGATRRMLLDFNYSGMGHLLAVSGLHLGLLTGLLWLLFAPLRLLRAHRLSRLLLLLLMWGYVLLIGSPPSAVRAAVMLTMFQAAWILRRTVFGWHNLGVAALALLVYDTRLIYNLSFQLSFTAAATLLYLSECLPAFVGQDEEHEERLRARFTGRLPLTPGERFRWTFGPWLRRLAKMLLYTVGLQIGLMPLTLHYFHHLPVVGCLQTFVVLPVLGAHLSLIVACLMCHALGAWLPAAAVLFDLGARFCWWCVDIGSRWILSVASWCRTADIRLFGDASWHLGTTATLGCYLLLVTLCLAYKKAKGPQA